MSTRPPLKRYFIKEKTKKQKSEILRYLFIVLAFLVIIGITCFPAIYNLFDTQDDNDIANDYSITDILSETMGGQGTSDDPRKNKD